MIRILSMIHPGMAFLILIGMVVVFVAGLLASGVVSIKIEQVDKDDSEEEDSEDKK